MADDGQQHDGIRVVDRRWWARGDAPDPGDGAAAAGAPEKPTYVEDLERRLAQKDQEIAGILTRYRESSQEFEQARVRFRRDVAREVERGTRAILVELIDVLDNLDRAVDAGRRAGSADGLQQGVEMVRDQFLAKLAGFGVTRMDPAGEAFDPARHEAAANVPVTDPARDGRVAGVIRHGYLIGDDTLRPAVVAVAQLTSEGAAS